MSAILFGISGFLFVVAFADGLLAVSGKSHIKSEAISIMFIASGVFAIAGALA